MSKSSFIYSGILSYRLLMQMLYKGNYYGRFGAVLKHVSENTVTELCFGDTIIAKHCKKEGITWTGLDINEAFVKKAMKKGFNASRSDISTLPSIPPADVVIICGSLYHFHSEVEELFIKMLAAAPTIIISEPVHNLSTHKGIIGKLARASANINGKEQHFRYTEKTLTDLLNILRDRLKFRFEITDRFSKDLIIVIKKNE